MFLLLLSEILVLSTTVPLLCDLLGLLLTLGVDFCTGVTAPVVVLIPYVLLISLLFVLLVSIFL